MFKFKGESIVLKVVTLRLSNFDVISSASGSAWTMTCSSMTSLEVVSPQLLPHVNTKTVPNSTKTSEKQLCEWVAVCWKQTSASSKSCYRLRVDLAWSGQVLASTAVRTHAWRHNTDNTERFRCDRHSSWEVVRPSVDTWNTKVKQTTKNLATFYEEERWVTGEFVRDTLRLVLRTCRTFDRHAWRQHVRKLPSHSHSFLACHCKDVNHPTPFCSFVEIRSKDCVTFLEVLGQPRYCRYTHRHFRLIRRTTWEVRVRVKNRRRTTTLPPLRCTALARSVVPLSLLIQWSYNCADFVRI